MEWYEYMRMPTRLIPPSFIVEYGLCSKGKDGFVYMEIQKGMYGLPQASILANQLLKKRLAKYGYYKVPHTPGLWKHHLRPIQFTLVVDDFGIKYVNKKDAKHLLNALKDHYKVEVDWTGELYCGITLAWNYKDRYVDISLPGYIKNNSRNMSTFAKDQTKTAPTRHHQKIWQSCPRYHPR
ncbi:hypothetical protein ACHAXS_000009 [Conticribra weissflogii]